MKHHDRRPLPPPHVMQQTTAGFDEPLADPGIVGLGLRHSFSHLGPSEPGFGGFAFITVDSLHHRIKTVSSSEGLWHQAIQQIA